MSKSQPVTQNTTQNNTIPQWLAGYSQQAAGEGANLPQYSAFTGPGPAGLTPQELQALGFASSTASQGQGITGQGVGAANALTGFQAPQVTAGGLNGQVSGLLSQSSPYTQNLINATNTQLQHNTAQGINAEDNNLAAQGAFGGTRQAVADAVQQNQGNMTMASTDAGLNQQGYNTALQTALAAGQGNQNAAIGGAGVQLGGVNALTGIGNAISGQNAQGLSGLLNAGGMAQNSQTAQNLFGYQNYLNQYQIPDQQASTFASILGSLPHSTSQTGTTQGNVYSNGLLGAAGLGLAAAGNSGVQAAAGTIGSNLMYALPALLA